MKNNNKLYMFTDENINSMTQKINLQDKDVLTITSSGDQALNFLAAGAKKVSLFDDNAYSEVYFYLKKALIENLSYEEFLTFFIPGFFHKKEYFSKEKYDLIKESLLYGKTREYWENIFNNFSTNEIRHMFVKRKNNKKYIIKRNNYLKDEENYNNLKEKLKNIEKVDFNHIDILHQILATREKVDFIYLSNLLNYIPAKNKSDYLQKLKTIVLNISHNLKEDGEIAVSYMHCYQDDFWHELGGNIQTIVSDSETKKDFLNKECKKIDFKGGYIPDSPAAKDRDAILVYKKTKKR